MPSSSALQVVVAASLSLLSAVALADSTSSSKESASSTSNATHDTTSKSSSNSSKLSAQKLALIGEDQGGAVSQLSLVTDDKGIRGILFKTLKGGTAGADPLSKFTLSQMLSSEGVVLVKDQGYNAVILKGKSLTSSKKYRLDVAYLKNAFTSNYGVCTISLEKQDDGTWQLKNSKSGAPISKILVKTWTMGITSLQGACVDDGS